jgi:hypothetical protein
MSGSQTQTTVNPNMFTVSSKAVLNFITLSIQKEHSDQSFIVFPIHPGWSDAEMSCDAASLFRNKKLPKSPFESAEAIFKLIDTATKKRNGQFVNYDGSALLW